jgi:hypothetical protein
VNINCVTPYLLNPIVSGAKGFEESPGSLEAYTNLP